VINEKRSGQVISERILFDAANGCLPGHFFFIDFSSAVYGRLQMTKPCVGRLVEGSSPSVLAVNAPNYQV
jgi:hypothetical protein